MNPRDWLVVAFVLTALMGMAAMYVADMQAKRQMAGESIEAVKVALTPFERDRRLAVEKINRVYGVEK